MKGHDFPRDGDSPPAHRQKLSELLREAEAVSETAISRLRRLNDRFPSAVPGPLLEQLERIRSDPRGERRGAVRLVGGQRVAVRTVPGERVALAPVLDRSPGGLAVRLGRYAALGEVVLVRLPGEGGAPVWFQAQVRYCRPDGDGWATGCEYLADRPPA